MAPKSMRGGCEPLLEIPLIRPQPDMRDPCPQRLEFDAKADLNEANRLAPWYQAQCDRVLEHLSLEPVDVVLASACAVGLISRRR